METPALERERKRGSAELVILALLDERSRHGYQIARLIDKRSRGFFEALNRVARLGHA